MVMAFRERKNSVTELTATTSAAVIHGEYIMRRGIPGTPPVSQPANPFADQPSSLERATRRETGNFLHRLPMMNAV